MNGSLPGVAAPGRPFHNRFTYRSRLDDNLPAGLVQIVSMKTKLCWMVVTVALGFSAGAADRFVAHEWGTFTSVHGADGTQIQWNPLVSTDLPGFVYSRSIRNGGFPQPNALALLTKGTTLAFLRMETPVIYFYSGQERTVDVTVTFEGGSITEWYPQATALGPNVMTQASEASRANQSFIEWKGVTILPPTTTEISADKLIRENQDNHYYAARETGANFLRTSSPHARNGTEYERDLFYRGVGFFQAPITLQLDANENYLRISTTNAEPISDLFVLTVRKGKARWQQVQAVNSARERSVKLDGRPFEPLAAAQRSIAAEMRAALVGHGLYDREAGAMVNTWKSQWFAEEGTRVLYLLPSKWTDRALPLRIQPQPDEVVRVMVGRAELITPAMEWEMIRQVVRYSSGDEMDRREAVLGLETLGVNRFIEPATRKILGRLPARDFSDVAWNLAREASLGGRKANDLVRRF
jgi:hypothetical protein